MKGTQAISGNPARRIFAPYFRGRSYGRGGINDYQYIEQIPSAYKQYYLLYIQNWSEWSRGYVRQLHDKDFFSCGTGYSVCELMTKMCMSGGYRITSADAAAKECIEKWGDEGLNEQLNEMFFSSNAVGNSILVLTPVNGELFLTAYPSTRVVFQIGRRNNITNATILNRFVAGSTTYYTREKRTKSDGKSYWKVELAQGTLATCPTWSGAGKMHVPDVIKEQWREQYGNIEPGVWYELPERMRNLGCYNVKNKANAAALIDMPGYSDSTLHTTLDILYALDYNFTNEMLDQYMGKSKALIPKQMAAREIKSSNVVNVQPGVSFQEAIDPTIQEPNLDKEFYTQISDGSIDGKPIQPTFMQPELRSTERKQEYDHLIEMLAGKIGINASTLASHLAAGSHQKTDDEIAKENDIDEKTVGNKRKLASTAVNKMLTDVAYFYGYDAKVEIQWGRSTNNSSAENDQLMNDYQAGTLPLRDYLRKRWTDLSEEEVEKMAVTLEQKQKEDQMQQFQMNNFNDKDYYGSDTEQTEQPGVDNGGSGNENPFDNEGRVPKRDTKAGY